ncbi:sigma 54-interacting transcriptional regulator [Pelotomaculum terephthalicicum JT]|uniref:sigma-54-dependent Fis family transcriptional regulator n=1 Tax=Pelotomaculum TaxID=191373 RepID=UPI0009C71CB3|nr:MULTISPECIES: sigma-54-dependent Fis family transcriptional regulator [Pelotomaculum]MCG9967731.1 sigma 54-interacting transcriptional regulator [Pelotomaculum terephthalicicum JT]OPX85349.1 MAG: Transcriptional regulatory protein ZraR [Pelotomaculum sp. PtaB.Bin117]OPY62718.1 MAG: Transcriptional regulatory protein ZraR [Pelotomaculum sp. PtaU1.Bin065]
MLAKNLTVPTALFLNRNSTIHEAIQIFRKTKLGGIPIVDSSNHLIGIFTRSNLFDCLLKGVSTKDTLVDHFITDVLYFKENERFNNLSELNQWLLKARIGQTPVVDLDGKPIGFITSDYIIRFLVDHIKSFCQIKNTQQKSFHQIKQEELYEINGTRYTIDSIIGKSKVMEELKRKALQAAKISATVLISGECGTGKELFAQAIHNASDRCIKPFININCAAIPAELAESELFGYEGGAFTGASKHGKPGKFELADKSTIFLDEIGDMPMQLQSKLLRIIQEKEVMRVGGLRAKKIDVRIIAATNQDLQKLYYDGKFRKDLYYRLKVVSLNIPPLRNHLEDIPTLVNYFVQTYGEANNKQIKEISKDATNFLQSSNWPGNIRELANVIERAVLFCKDNIIRLEDLENSIVESGLNICSLNNLEKETILQVLKNTHGNKSKTAKLLGISRSTLYRKLEGNNIY